MVVVLGSCGPENATESGSTTTSPTTTGEATASGSSDTTLPTGVVTVTTDESMTGSLPTTGTTPTSHGPGEGSTASSDGGPSCGNGVLDPGEACDDGNIDDGDGCPSGPVGACQGEAVCGDGLVWTGVESCDDGNGGDNDACPSGIGACLAGAICGDGFIWTGEEDCEDGNLEDLDGCSNACATPRWVFISSTQTDGIIGGVAGADALCQGYAEAAGLSGTYQAWLSQDAESAPAFRFGSTSFKGWYLQPTVPPTPVAQGWDDLTGKNEDNKNNYLRNAINADEFGNLLGETGVWSNTGADGFQHEFGVDCNDRAEIPLELSGSYGLSRSDVLTTSWSHVSAIECNVMHRLYCFQTG